MIQEEDEFAESKYKLSDYLPSQNFDINEYLPKARAAKNQRVNEILASLEEDSENLSVLSSVDTEALLHSSDEESPPKNIQNKGKFHEIQKKIPKNMEKSFEYFNKKSQNDDFSVISSVDTEALLLSSDEEDHPIKKQKKPDFSLKNSKNPENPRKDFQDLQRPKASSLSIGKTSVLNLIPKRMSLETSSISIPASKMLSKSALVWKPSDVFNSFRQQAAPMRSLKVCTCILAGSIFAHQRNCAPVTILADFSQKPVPLKRKLGVLEAVVLIQKEFRRFLRKKAKITVKKDFPVFYIDQAAKTLNNAYKELEVLKSMASDRSSEISMEGNEFEMSSVDTDSLLNSSFSSILSRGY
jgi:hypothetical protein